MSVFLKWKNTSWHLWNLLAMLPMKVFASWSPSSKYRLDLSVLLKTNHPLSSSLLSLLYRQLLLSPEHSTRKVAAASSQQWHPPTVAPPIKVIPERKPHVSEPNGSAIQNPNHPIFGVLRALKSVLIALYMLHSVPFETSAGITIQFCEDCE